MAEIRDSRAQPKARRERKNAAPAAQTARAIRRQLNGVTAGSHGRGERAAADETAAGRAAGTSRTSSTSPGRSAEGCSCQTVRRRIGDCPVAEGAAAHFAANFSSAPARPSREEDSEPAEFSRPARGARRGRARERRRARASPEDAGTKPRGAGRRRSRGE